MIKIEKHFDGRQCNCCHKEEDVMEYDFRSSFNNSGICVALCGECRAKLREMLDDDLREEGSR